MARSPLRLIAVPVSSTSTLFDGAACRRLTYVGLALFVVAILWELGDADLSVMQMLAPTGRFALKNNWWMETVLHTGMQQVSRVGALLLWISAFRPFGLARDMLRRERFAIAWIGTISAIFISLLKQGSLTSCPWDLVQFGGTAQHVSHWAWGVADGGDGGCFPAGHPSAALCFLAVCLPGLTNADASARRRGWLWFIVILGAGAGLGFVQILRGAHYPSHVLWTMVICWWVSAVLWTLSIPGGGGADAVKPLQVVP